MNYKRIGALCFALLTSTFILRSQENIVSSGGEAFSSSGNVSYSVSQVSYAASAGSNGSVEAGVQQSYSILTSLGSEITSIQLEVKAYPNPVVNSLTLKVEDFNQENLIYILFDMQGKLLEEKQISSAVTQIEVEHLSKSTYFLKIIDQNRPIKTFNIIKN